MANDYVPDLVDLAPGEVARSSDVNERYTNTVSGFDKLPAPKVGEKGFSEPCPVGTPVNPDHAVTKNWAETAMSSQLAQATTQAGNAATSAAGSATSASNAATSASNAQTSASAASQSANNAAISQSSASSSASSATSSKNAAAASASAASTSASNAASSASSASSSASSALSAKNAAEAAFDQFDDRYLGAKETNPSADNDGNTLSAGALYFNTVFGEMRVWSGTQWLTAYLPPSNLLIPGDNISELVNDANYLTGNQSITLTGDATGTGTTSINVTVVNDSHTHDTRYYTEGEIQSFFAGSTAITGYDRDNWSGAYNDRIVSAEFSTTTGVLTLNQQDAGEITVDLDGRYLTSATTYTNGAGISLTGTVFSHADTSTQTTSTNAGQKFIQSIELDTYGHITSLATGTALNTTYTNGDGITLSGTQFSHADTSNQSSVSNSGNNFIKSIELDTYGHITGITSGTAADTNTNTTYSISAVDSGTNAIIRLTAGGAGSGNDDITLVAGSNVTLTPNDASTITISSTDTNTQRAIHNTPVDGATTTSISSNWAFDNVKTPVPAGAVFTDTNTFRAIHNTPVNGATTTSISSDWAFKNVKTAVPAGAIFTDTDTIYTHPGYAGDDINLDTGVLAGATVISDLDFNVTTDTLGHVTDANATYDTKTITAADVGAAPTSHTHDQYLRSDTGDTATGTYSFNNTTESTSSTTGALKISGGIGVAKNIHGGGVIRATKDGATDHTWNTEAALQAAGTWGGGLALITPLSSAGYMIYTSGGGTVFHIGQASTTASISDQMTLSNGDLIAAGNVTAYSDARLKDNVETLDGSKVYEMRGVSFTKDGQAGSGVIAQELQQIAPELVCESGEYLSVAYGNLVGYLIEAVKDLKKEIEELKNAAS